MHAIHYDEIHDEIVVPQPFGQAILTFRGGANGEEAPIRVIQGSRTQLINPDKLAIDPVNNEYFVAEAGSVLVFPREANGNVAPLRVLNGPDGDGMDASELAVDPVHNLLVVVGQYRGNGQTGREGRVRAVMTFDRTAKGNAKPRTVIAGPKAGLQSVTRIQVYPPRGLIFVPIRSGELGELESADSHLAIWSIDDDGDVPPRWTIGGPKGMLKMPRGVALDPKNKNVLISDKRLNAVLTYHFPEVF